MNLNHLYNLFKWSSRLPLKHNIRVMKVKSHFETNATKV